jgi:uncharacterized protein YjbJ (UPF0337 family)
MDKERVEGGLKKITGAAKEKVGKIIGDRKLEAEKAEGKVRSAVGHVKDAAREIGARH